MAEASGDGRVPGVFWPSIPRLAREGASALRMATVPVDRFRRRAPVPAYRVPALLIPGYMAGDWTMARMERMLHARGHPTMRARIGMNVGCTMELVERLEERLETFVTHRDRRVAVVGWSRGGMLGKLLTLRRPDLVAGLVTLASPTVHPLAVNRFLNLHLRTLTRLNAVGARMVLGADCVDGDCARQVRETMEQQFPAGLPFTAFYSKTDGVVDWRACCDRDADCVEVKATHVQMGANAGVIALVVSVLDAMDGEPAAVCATA
ncbi:MAG: esterase/lipase family protein [Candidatus Dormibacteria bacterium]